MKRHFLKLDGARGLAILFVLFSHASILPGLQMFSGIGHRGVYLFFVLSAFLLTLPMLGKDWQWFLCWRTWRNYFVRRTLRVYPLYAFVLIISWILSTRLHVISPYRISNRNLHTSLLLDYAPDIFWSVPIEFKYYFVLPFVAFFLGIACRRDFWRAAAWTAGFLTLYFLFAEKALFLFPHVTLTLYLPIFLCGSLTALFQDRFAGRGKNGLIFSACAALLLIVAILSGPHFGALLNHGEPRDLFPDTPYLQGPFWCAFLLCAVRSSGAIARVLESKALRFVGQISFSLYLLHMPIIKTLDAAQVLGVVRTPLFFAGAFLAATLAHYSIEAPLMRFAHRITRKPRDEPAQQTRVLAFEKTI